MSLPFIIYSVSVLPTILIITLYYKKVLPLWVMKVYVMSFLICAFGWEIWYTYGWVDGDHVNLRRTDYLNRAIPAHVNWIVNSLYDAAICLTGLLWVWLAGGKTLRLFHSINVWVIVILFLLSPKWIDTITLFGATMKFHVQMTWVLMVPIFFLTVRYFKPQKLDRGS